jgi:L-alanine-DL-glutamate epimerase-like enolase superfamily enzyme
MHLRPTARQVGIRRQLIIVEITDAGATGLGYTYGDKAISIIARQLAEKGLRGPHIFAIRQLHQSMRRQVGNNGNQGITAMSISAVTSPFGISKRGFGRVPVEGEQQR